MAHEHMIQNTTQLTYAAAAVAIEAAVVRSRELAALECIAVVDAGGNLLAFARVEGAAVLAREPAIAKAATSASLGMASGSIPFELGANLGAASQGTLVNLGGGLPIVFRSMLLGAIGVGSGTTEQDVAVAEAGRDAVLKLLAASD